MTMELILLRSDLTPTRTIGRLYLATPECWTLEDARREGPKVPGETAIPAGRYQVKITKSQRFNRMLPLLLDVPGFEGIRIHSGNSASDTAGCVLVGRSRTENTILESRLALEALMPKIADAQARGQDVWVTIV
jgi:hypothetical protein